MVNDKFRDAAARRLRRQRFKRLNSPEKRLKRIERKLEKIMKHLGIPGAIEHTGG